MDNGTPDMKELARPKKDYSYTTTGQVWTMISGNSSNNATNVRYGKRPTNHRPHYNLFHSCLNPT
jgi:hypothetical protein